MKRRRQIGIVTLIGVMVTWCGAQGPVFRSTVREVSVVFRVLDKQGRPVSGITRDEIRVEDEGLQRNITSFSGEAAYSQVVVAADVSGSMGEVLEPLQGALFDFADLVGKDSNRERGDVLLSLLPFSESATMLVDRTPDPQEFKSAVSHLRPSGSTALIDAILSTLLNAFGDVSVRPVITQPKRDDMSPIPTEFRRRPPRSGMTAKRSKFLVVFTDAGENSSAHAWTDIASTVLGSEVVIYSVVFDSGTPDANVSKLASITRDSGGEVYRARASDLKHVYAQIAKNIRGHYLLTFNANDVASSRIWRNVRVSTTRPGVVVVASTGYCPDSPCQKADGTFIGGNPKTWSQVIAMNRDPAMVSAVKQRLQGLAFRFTGETQDIVSSLSTHPLLVEKRWKQREKGNKPYFVTHPVLDGKESVSIDTQACGIKLAPEHNAVRTRITDTPSLKDHPVLAVVDPEIRVSRRPSGSQSKVIADDQDDYFQSQAIFYLVDKSGMLPCPLKVQCNRPHFLVGNGLVEFASEATAEALKLTVEGGTREQSSMSASN